MGFDWRIGTALIGAFAAKEVFVAQMGIVFAVGEADEESGALRERLRASYTPLQGFCIMLFCLISLPCMATVAVTRRESNSWKWALLQVGGLTMLAYVLTLVVYQVGMLAGIGGCNSAVAGDEHDGTDYHRNCGHCAVGLWHQEVLACQQRS